LLIWAADSVLSRVIKVYFDLINWHDRYRY
jgi:hypothetical protein